MTKNHEEPILRNQAFIDGQNLYMNTTANSWKADLKKFRIYLRDQYQVADAYYFLGAVDNNNQELYELIQKAGFILVFREHSQSMIGKKKGNVDTDIVFTIMAKIADQEDFDKVVLVSGDGDYYKMVNYLVKKTVLPNFSRLIAILLRHFIELLRRSMSTSSIILAFGRRLSTRSNQKSGFFLGISPFELPASVYSVIIANFFVKSNT